MCEKAKFSRRERDRLQHKEDILAAALKLFADRGFHEVSMQEIADRAEFATGTLYNFFASKEALFEELICRCADRIIEDLERVLERPGDEVTVLRGFFRHLSELVERYNAFLKVYVSAVGTRAATCRNDESKNRVSARVSHKIEQLLISGIRKRLFRSVAPEVTTTAIESLLETVVFQTTGHVNRTQLTDIFAKVEHLFVDGLLLPGGQ